MQLCLAQHGGVRYVNTSYTAYLIMLIMLSGGGNVAVLHTADSCSRHGIRSFLSDRCLLWVDLCGAIAQFRLVPI